LTQRILVIGVGNQDRGDDAAGLLIARQLRLRALPHVSVVEETGEGAALMDVWQTAKASIVFLIDAVSSGREPGFIYRLDASARQIPASFFHYSTHAFSVAEAVEMARVLGELPPHLVIYGIEGKQFAIGGTCSPAVDQAIPIVVDCVVQDITQINCS